MLPEFPKARKKIMEMWHRVFFAEFHRNETFSSQIPIRVQKEGKSAFINGSEVKYKPTSVTSSYKLRDAKGMSPEEFFGLAVNLGKNMRAEQEKEVFLAMSKPSPYSRSITCDGSITFELVIDTWLTMEVNFGTDGRPNWPSIILNPQALAELKDNWPQWMEDPIKKSKMDWLINQKRKEFDEREAHRRLVD